MKHVLSALALAGLTAASALAIEPVFLRDQLTTEGSHITLGDLFEVEGEAAEARLARAPAPGSRTALDPNYVRRIASENGLTWGNPSNLLRVSVSRASQTIEAGLLAELLEEEFFARDGRPYEVRLSNSSLVLYAPVEAALGLQLDQLNHDARSGLFSVMVSAYPGADPVRISGRAHATVDVPVLARPVGAGDVIQAEDIAWVAVRGDRLRPDALTDEIAMIGQEARRALRANEPVRGYDLVAPTAIERGETVTLVFSARGLQLSVQARALGNVAEGEIGRFVNLHSNRTIEARAEGPGLARVGAASAAF
jgi:flagella basal body P-ring formation protein FlgA